MTTIASSGALASMMDMYRYKKEVGQLQKLERDIGCIDADDSSDKNVASVRGEAVGPELSM